MSRSNESGRSIHRESIDSAWTTIAERCGQFAQLAASVERELWHVAIGLMLIDVTLTVHGLEVGLVEQNPAARAVLDAAGVLGLYALKAAALGVALVGWLILSERHRFVVPLGLAVPNAFAVAINTAVIGYVVI